jgi:hypothetical protein
MAKIGILFPSPQKNSMISDKPGLNRINSHKKFFFGTKFVALQHHAKFFN